MEPSQLQLVLNVVMITGVTSLGGYCYLLKKENGKLVGQKSAPKTVASDSAESVELDIRALASARRKTWVESATTSTAAPE